MTLKQTLAQLQQQAKSRAQWEQDKPKMIEEWRQAVASLITDIRGYLAEYQADGSMSFSDKDIELSEEQLGRYRINAMFITAGPATIVVAPVGTMIVGAFGRVDIYRQGSGGERDRIVLLRMRTSPTDQTFRWVFASLPEVGTSRRGVKIRRIPQRQVPQQSPERIPLSKATLEQCLEFLLSRGVA